MGICKDICAVLTRSQEGLLCFNCKLLVHLLLHMLQYVCACGYVCAITHMGTSSGFRDKGFPQSNLVHHVFYSKMLFPWIYDFAEEHMPMVHTSGLCS